jgi:hypothetical protein
LRRLVKVKGIIEDAEVERIQLRKFKMRHLQVEIGIGANVLAKAILVPWFQQKGLRSALWGNTDLRAEHSQKSR